MYARIQRDDKALADFYHVVALSPDNPIGHEWIGLVEYQQGYLNNARQQLSIGRALAPNDGQVARELGDVLASQDDQLQALALYDQAIQLDPSNAQIYAARAALLHHLGMADPSIPDLRKVMVLTGDVQEHQWALRWLGNLIGTTSKVSSGTD